VKRAVYVVVFVGDTGGGMIPGQQKASIHPNSGEYLVSSGEADMTLRQQKTVSLKSWASLGLSYYPI